MNCREDFDLGRDTIWLNTSHQGALPRAAAREAEEVVRWKLRPWEMTSERFSGVPRRLREALGRWVGVPADEVVLSNGASRGVHLLAAGMPLGRGDEVLLMRGDFPSNALPWMLRRRDGVEVRVLAPEGPVLTSGEIEAALTPRTRVVCLSWVHSFSGHALDLQAIGELCRRRGVWFVANTTQALGARSIDLSTAPVDAVVNAGWKWLCGPYGTGFSWVRPELLAQLTPHQAYWLSGATADDLEGDAEPAPPERVSPRQLDLFGTANFFNFAPFAASVEYLYAQGPDRIERHVQALVARLLEGLDATRYARISAAGGAARSSIVVLTHRDRQRNRAIRDRLRNAGIVVALRRGNLRVSPHLYNGPDEIDRLLEVLLAAGGD